MSFSNLYICIGHLLGLILKSSRGLLSWKYFRCKVEVEFSDGSIFHLSAEFLRIYSPAADSKIRSVGGEKVIFGRRHVGIMSAEPVGNYGVRIAFDDLHKTGIYTWDYFYHLGTNKFTLMRNYIQTLKKHGLSRDPQRKK
ncbi:myb domain protein isoform X3 [Tasmannia lanceolata]|uniref:myb domain protein isoform X3 n=1 Tax=Tasmannia lanceolata TaxID=3420 RepID=UPI004062F755